MWLHIYDSHFTDSTLLNAAEHEPFGQVSEPSHFQMRS
jgi:hypothetical protein